MAQLQVARFRLRISEPGPGARRACPRSAREVQLAAEAKPEAIMRVANDADALLATYAKITADMIRQMTRCRIISRFGIGVDNVDIAAATERGIVVTKVPDYCIDEVSDHAMALLLAAVRKIPLANSRCTTGAGRCRRWCRSTACAEACWGWWASGAYRNWWRPRRKAFGMRVVSVRSVHSEERFRERAGVRERGVRRTAEDIRLHFDP